MSNDPKAIVLRLEELWNTGNLSIADEVFASDFVNNDPSRPDVTDLDGYKTYVTDTRFAFPDFKVTIDDILAEEDKVAARYTVSGTHEKDFPGLPATGKKATWTGINIYRLSSGKIAEVWWSKDGLTMLQELGVIPAE
jgi:steroid delta-isomerase-like uncharacterized protein